MKRNFIIVAIIILTLLVYKTVYNRRTLGVSDNKLSNVCGIVIPHHDLAEELIINAIDKVSHKTYSRIVILAPNHFFPENYFVVTADEFNEYTLDTKLISEMVASSENVHVNTDLIKNEHGVTVPMQYLVHQFPDAQFVPLAVSPYYTDKAILELVRQLTNSPDSTLFVLAVDFAHNVSLDEGLDHNNESINALKSFNYQEILTYSDKHVDSPLATVLFLKTMEKLECTFWSTIESSHSSMLEGISDLEGTSYVVGTFSN